MKQKLVWVSAHDFSSAQICAEADVDTILVGDSLGMTVYGYESTRQVTMEMMLRHSEAVMRAVPTQPPVIVDMPYGSYADVETALANAGRFSDIGINNVKLEGGSKILPQVEALIRNGFAVTGHLGLLPQSADRIGVAGRGAEAGQILDDAERLEQAGVSFLVLECVPAALGKRVSDMLAVPVIGIGAGPDVDGQVLVYADLIGRSSPSFSPKFLRRFGNVRTAEKTATQKFAASVRSGEFPNDSESYNV